MIIRGDANHIPLPDESIDCIVTDPPYGYSFMGKSWDKVVVSIEIWKECLRVLKAGSFAFIMSAPRQDVLSRMIVNLQDAGFETGFSSLYHTYASGFPKAANVSKLVDKRATSEAKALDGSYAGFQPKPAVEIVLTVMKPLSEKSYVDQALANRKGVTWLDDCRIPYQNEDDINNTKAATSLAGQPRLKPEKGWNDNKLIRQEFMANQKGRFPANLLVSDDVLNDGKITKGSVGIKTGFGFKESGYRHGYRKARPIKALERDFNYNDSGSYSRYFDLDKWFDTTFPFLIFSKASKSERNMGLITSYMEDDKAVWDHVRNLYTPKKVNDGRQTPIDNPFQRGETLRVNSHPTVKPIKLMSYLIMLGSREGDSILDPFVGSGTTSIAAKMLNRKHVGIEINQEYCDIANARLIVSFNSPLTLFANG